MDVAEEPVSEHGANGRFGFGFQQIEEGGHGIAHRFLARRHVPRAPQKHGIVAVARQNGSFDQASDDARLKQFAIPVPVGLADQSTGTAAADDFPYRLPHKPECLPVTSCGQRIEASPVDVQVVRVPVTRAHPVDHLRCDAVALDRQRVIGIVSIDFVNEGEIARGITWQSGRFGECCDHRTPHCLPERLQAPHNRRRHPTRRTKSLLRLKRIGFSDIVACALHDTQNLIGHVIPADSAKGAGQPSGNHRVTPIKQPCEHTGRIADTREHDPRLDWVPDKHCRRHTHQCCFGSNEPQTVPVLQIGVRRHVPYLEVEQ